MTIEKNKYIYVQYGCGFSVGEDWINYDSSPTLRLERLPLLGGLLTKLSGNSQRFPSQVKYGDIVKGLPHKENSVKAVYASHILEHLALDDFRIALANTYRMLEPNGLFRLIVPDLETRAKRYLDSLAAGATDANSIFLASCHLGSEKKPKRLLARLRALYGGSAHLWMWDDASISRELRQIGFTDIHRCSYGDASDPMFKRVESEGRFIDSSLCLPELAIQSRKPVIMN